MSRRAFTLLEIMLVMAILVIVASISYPSLQSMYGGFKIQAAADTVRAAWADCRTHAINEGRAYRFSVTPGTGRFRAAPDSAEFWSGSGSDPTNTSDPSGPALVLEDSVPDGVSLTPAGSASGNPGTPSAGSADGNPSAPSAGGDSGSWTTTVIFLPDGTCRDDAELTLQVRGVRSMVLKIRGLTGAVRLQNL